MLYSLSTFRERLLLALADHDGAPDGFVNLSELARSTDLDCMSGWILHSVSRLEFWGFIETDNKDPHSRENESHIAARITEKGNQHLNSEKSKNAVANLRGAYETYFPESSVDWVILSSLLVMAESANRGRPASFNDIKDFVLRDSEEPFVREALDQLISSGFVRRVHRFTEPEGYELTSQGTWFTIQNAPTIFDFEQWPHADQPSEDVFTLLENIREWESSLHGSASAHVDGGQDIPASDRIVSLDDNSAAYRDAVEKVGDATDAIRGFNGATNFNKELVVGQLEAFMVLLKNRKLHVGAVTYLALEPLYAAYNDAAVEAFKPLFKAAIDALIKLFGF